MKVVSPKTYLVNVSALPAVPTHAVSNYAEGNDAISIARNNPSVKTKVGMDGKMSAAITADRSGKIKLKLMQTSPSNKVLAAILALQEGGPLTFTPLFVQFVDMYRQDVAAGAFGVITKWPDMTRGDEVTDQEWEIEVERLDLALGDPAFVGLPTAASEASL